MPLTERRESVVAALVAVLVLTLPGVALAQDDKDASHGEVVAESVEKEITSNVDPATPEPAEVLSILPVLGTGLNITIGRGDEGEIASIALDPDTATVVEEGDHRVLFLLADGETEVVVKSGKGFVQTTVRADDTADVTGDGSWSADVFGNGTITVPYNVGFDGITPTISVGSITTPDGVTADVGEPKTRTSDEADKAYTRVRIELASEEQTAVLSLKAKVYVNDDGETRVKVSATLSSRDRVRCHFGERRGDDRQWSRDSNRDQDRSWDKQDREGSRRGHDGRRGDSDDSGGGDDGEPTNG